MKSRKKTKIYEEKIKIYLIFMDIFGKNIFFVFSVISQFDLNELFKKVLFVCSAIWRKFVEEDDFFIFYTSFD
jgi:hypothetical protein